MAKSKEQKRAEARARRLDNLYTYRQRWLEAHSKLKLIQDMHQRGEIRPFPTLSMYDTGVYMIENQTGLINSLHRDMVKAAASAGVDLHGNPLAQRA
jgi:hypothetical protein